VLGLLQNTGIELDIVGGQTQAIRASFLKVVFGQLKFEVHLWTVSNRRPKNRKELAKNFVIACKLSKPTTTDPTRQYVLTNKTSGTGMMKLEAEKLGRHQLKAEALKQI
jgi:hypothetical protein